MVQASSGEQPITGDGDINMAGSGGEPVTDIHAVPDVELLQMQKQRSMPRVSLSEVSHEGEVVHAVVDDFAQVSGGAETMGMAAAGTEEQVIRQLQRAGSLNNADVLLPDTEENKAN